MAELLSSPRVTTRSDRQGGGCQHGRTLRQTSPPRFRGHRSLTHQGSSTSGPRCPNRHVWRLQRGCVHVCPKTVRGTYTTSSVPSAHIRRRCPRLAWPITDATAPALAVRYGPGFKSGSFHPPKAQLPSAAGRSPDPVIDGPASPPPVSDASPAPSSPHSTPDRWIHVGVGVGGKVPTGTGGKPRSCRTTEAAADALAAAVLSAAMPL